jgi:nucleoside-diphosphate-sugar epimerase
LTSYLVTGGAGFIGSNIVETLVARGDSVTVVDNLSTGKRENLAPFLSKIKFIEGDICDAAAMAEAVKGVEYVFHEAALPSVPRSVADPLASNSAQVDGTLTMLLAAKKAGVRRVIYAGSSSVYGDTEQSSKVETMAPNPKSPYAVGKLTGEYYCRVWHTLYGLETVVLRYFNVFGPRQDPQSQYAAVAPLFITAIMNGRRPVIHGDGLQSRDFTYIENVVNANILACGAPKAAGEVINVACGERTTVLQMARYIAEILGAKLEPEHTPTRPGDIRHSLADIAKARGLLGFEPKVGVREGLARTVEWYRKMAR